MAFEKHRGIALVAALTLLANGCNNSEAGKHSPHSAAPIAKPVAPAAKDTVATKATASDTTTYNRLQLHLVHGKPGPKWPVLASFPLPGTIFPFKRVVAYYGNFYSKGMGILGELPHEEMLQQLQQEAKAWELADTLIPVLPAIQYIAVTAQRSPGKGSKYRIRMPFQQIDTALQLARKIKGILIIDVQVGHSTLEEELPVLEPWLMLPDVHLAIDPEYSMKGGEVPSATVGNSDAEDINYAANYLASLVTRYSLPPKILVVHRFTKGMLTNARNIKLHPQVQVVINMDGFGFAAKKINSYNTAVANEPVQYTGFKIFYKNDKLAKPYKLMEPAEVLKLNPSPIYIQYQ